MRTVQISLRDVSHDYGPSDESAPVHVLDHVSLDIASGDFAVLMGASGSGKSTLLNLMVPSTSRRPARSGSATSRPHSWTSGG
jgi:ABC-type lipoprotein export system ATPase subunit